MNWRALELLGEAPIRHGGYNPQLLGLRGRPVASARRRKRGLLERLAMALPRLVFSFACAYRRWIEGAATF
ncbi:MAG: hypothetical protein JRF15_04410 [Deltaproteobacteria bacterium]|nr:hypothetical protein [Deltaproteobacteria bacterium]